ncbi:hypothetical protein LguiB_020562 [Lonicera macranthoides]
MKEIRKLGGSSHFKELCSLCGNSALELYTLGGARARRSSAHKGELGLEGAPYACWEHRDERTLHLKGALHLIELHMLIKNEESLLAFQQQRSSAHMINGSYKPEEVHTLGDSHKPKEEYTLKDCMAILKSMNLSGRQFKLAKAKFEQHIYWRIFFLVITLEDRLDWAINIG